jgi:hypothetical protein
MSIGEVVELHRLCNDERAIDRGDRTTTEIVQRFGGGGSTDPLLLVSHAGAGAFKEPACRSSVRRRQNLARAVPGTKVVTPSDRATAADPSRDDGRATLDRVRATGIGAVGGSPAEDADFTKPSTATSSG